VHTIAFEGGFGSQVLAYIEMEFFAYKKFDFDLDLSYFTTEDLQSIDAHRPWRLSKFGIEIADIQSTAKKNRKIRSSEFRSTNRDLWDFGKKNAERFFPFDSKPVLDFLKNNGIDTKKKFTAIHIRRGDYLQLSSKIVTDQEVMDLVSKLSNLINDFIVISSDSVLSRPMSKFFNQFALTRGKKILVLDSLEVDEVLIHQVFRLSDILICSNSTFSFSAAILAKKSNVSFAPIDFFDPLSWGGTTEKINRKFRDSGNFFILE
jgi:hypothetical protein